MVGAPRIVSSPARGFALTLAVSVGFVFLAAQPARAAPPGPPPGDLWAAQTGPNVVTLVWSQPEKVSEFRVFQLEGGTFKQISAPRSSADTFTLTVRPPWAVRKYAIDAVFEDGTVSEKALFNEIRVEEAKPGSVPAPASVIAEQTGPGEVTIRWSEVPDATAFVIGRSVGTGGLQMLCRICPTTGRYVDRAVQPGAKHTYSVTALAARGPSRRATSNVLVPTGAPAVARAETAPAPPPIDASFVAEPRAGGCLSLGGEGNLLVRLADGTVREIEAPEKPVPGVAGVVAVASSKVNRYALLEDGRLLGWGHPRFWPKGVVTVLDTGRQTAQECAMRWPGR